MSAQRRLSASRTRGTGLPEPQRRPPVNQRTCQTRFGASTASLIGGPASSFRTRWLGQQSSWKIGFLVTVAILEAVFGSPEGASAAWLHRNRLSDDDWTLRRLPFASWRSFPQGATFYASNDLLAVAGLNPTPDSDEYVSVWVGARDQSALSALDSMMDESWEYDSRLDR
jgi:hypothetical protein